MKVQRLSNSSDETFILNSIESGDISEAKGLLIAVYNELRSLARAKLSSENPGLTLQATALVHEAFIRLVDSKVEQKWHSRGHFFDSCSQDCLTKPNVRVTRSLLFSEASSLTLFEVAILNTSPQRKQGNRYDLMQSLPEIKSSSSFTRLRVGLACAENREVKLGKSLSLVVTVVGGYHPVDHDARCRDIQPDRISVFGDPTVSRYLVGECKQKRSEH